MKHKLFAVVALMTMVLFALPSFGSPKSGKKASKSMYMVTSTHTQEQCMTAMGEMKDKAPKMLDKCWMGCESGNHTCWMVVQAGSEDDAKAMIPEAVRGSAQVAKVSKMSAASVKAAHEMK